MELDSDVKNQLEIFWEEVHPSQIKGKGKSKEGFSIFSSFCFTTTPGGRKILHNWFSNPLKDPTEIK